MSLAFTKLLSIGIFLFVTPIMVTALLLIVVTALAVLVGSNVDICFDGERKNDTIPSSAMSLEILILFVCVLLR